MVIEKLGKHIFPWWYKWSSRSLHLYFCYCCSHIHSKSDSHLFSL